MPALVRTVAESTPGFTPTNKGSIIGASITNTPVTITIPATGATTPSGGTAFNTTGGPAPTRGKFRLRTSSVNAATVDTVKFTVTDGTTTLVVDIIGPTAAGDALDYTGEFNTDLSITSISAIFTQSGATQQATADFEVSLT